MELGILDWITQNIHTNFLDVVMPWISRLGDNGAIWIIVALALLFFGEKETGARVVLALLLSLLLCNLILKNAVGRMRPCEVNTMVNLLIPCPTDPSFPSGHTSASFAAATVLIATKWKGRWLALALAVLIAFSRMYLYVHFPTDILGGLILGVICGLLSLFIWEKWGRKSMSILKPKND